MGLFDAVASLITTPLTNRANRKIANATNKFNAAEAQLNRQFQAQEAQIARDWQESQYNLYSSPQAMVRQYQDAGLNPALMYGQNLQGSTGSSTMPSGSSASGTAIPMQAPSFSGIVEDIKALATLKQEIRESKSREAANYAAAGKSNSDVELNKQTIAESKQKVLKMIKETSHEETKQALTAVQVLLAEEDKRLKNAQTVNITYDNFKKEFERAFASKFGAYPSSSALEVASHFFGQLVTEIEHYTGKATNFVKSFFK